MEFDNDLLKNFPTFNHIECGCGMPVVEKYKKDCYFYYEEMDMGGRIPTCSYFERLGECPCDGCNHYIKSSEVFELVKKKVNFM